MINKLRAKIVLLSIFLISGIVGCSIPEGQQHPVDVENVNSIGAGMSETDATVVPLRNDGVNSDFDSVCDLYEYYLTKEEVIADIEQGYIFKMDTAFTSKIDAGSKKYEAPYVLQDNWSFYVHENNTIDLEIAFSNLCTKPNKNIFPGSEQITVEVISPDEQSVYRFEKIGDAITEDTSVQEQIAVTPGEWKLQISFAYVCGKTPSHLKIAAAYEAPSEEDLNWLKGARLIEKTSGAKSAISTVNTDITQGGPYGEISLSLPDGWSYELCPMDSELYGMYGIKFFPKDADDGYVEISYTGSFGVCGMGLVEESAAVAGEPAYIGTFDNHEYWDFVAFDGEYDGMVALTHSVDEWWSEYGDQALEILDTLSYDPSIKEGGACINSEESQISEIAVSFFLKNITPTGATLVFRQYDAKAPKGELIFGEDYVIEVLKDGKWEEAPIPIEGNYAFIAVGYMLPCEEITEREIDWEWLYGELAPGEYRIGKGVSDVKEVGSNDHYMVYAHFILN